MKIPVHFGAPIQATASQSLLAWKAIVTQGRQDHVPVDYWSVSLLPAYVSAASVLILALQSIVTFFRPSPSQNSPSVASNFKERVRTFGPHIYAFHLVRFFSTVALLGISIVSFTLKSERVHLHVALTVSYAYAVVLGLVGLGKTYTTSRIVLWHMNTVLLSSLGLYCVRDVYPLLTYTLEPLDGNEGALLWAQIGLLTIACIVVPLFIPRRYIPVDINNPMLVLNPEQTVSIFSLSVYTFLDPVVRVGNQHKQLNTEQLPALADSDYSKNLKAGSFKHLDFYSGAKKRHLFFGLMRTFRLEYAIMVSMIILNVVGYFASPIGINRYCSSDPTWKQVRLKFDSYLESDGENAVVRPWVWILWIFLGPTIGTMAIQWYIFIATRTLVRCESILTQLVFDHSLRIRMKAETDSDSTSDEQTLHSAAPTEITEGETVASTDETLRGSTSTDTASTSSKQKKGTKASEAEGSSSANNLVGKINNLVTTDLNNIVEGRDFLFGILYIPLQIGLSIWFLYVILGYSAFVGLAVIVVTFPVPGFVAKKAQDFQKIQLQRTDARVQTISDVMNVLRMIKLFAWERKMEEKLTEKREAELIYVRYRKLLDLLNGELNFLIPCLVMLATFGTHTAIMGERLTASKVFSCLTVFDMLRDQLHTIFWAVTQSLTAKVSLDRVDDFLRNTELLDSFTEKEESLQLFEPSVEAQQQIGFRNSSFTWSADADGSLTPSKRKFVLRIDDELLFEKGKINLIIGPTGDYFQHTPLSNLIWQTGSGKTSILMALLGEMHWIKTEPDSWFNLPRQNGVAYAAQEAFILNATIKENILFGEPLDETRYKTVLQQCALERDIELFEAGDQTEVGEKGLTLSGGQRARISLARAVYSSKPILLLDDVLSALDVHTSKWIVEECFSKELVQNRTVILVSHAVALCRPIASYVISMDINGRVRSRGSASETLTGSKIAKEVKEEKETLRKAAEEIDPQSEAATASKKADGKLILAEETAEGHLSWAALKLYLAGMGGSHPFLFFLAVLGGLLSAEIINASQTLWLGLFAREYETHEDVAVNYYLTVYVLLLLASLTASAISNINFIFGAIRASRSLHRQLINAVFGTTLRWLDTTPTSFGIGRVITRATQDIRSIDSSFIMFFWFVLELSATMLTKFVAVILSAPAFLVPGVFVAASGSWIGQLYITAQMSVKREMSSAKSPVLAHFGAAIAGLTSIRAYGAQRDFVLQQQTRIDRYTRAARTFYNLNRWVCIRIDLISSVFASALAAYLVYGNRVDSTRTWVHFEHGDRIFFYDSMFEVQGNSLERIQEYIVIEQEPKATEAGVPPAAWPTSGDLKVEKLNARYSPDGPKVLKDISFDIPAGQRVGVVGRTGSGKSSLTLALLRCIFTEGNVLYDGINTTDVNLDALRSQITIIPQMPELLKGSLRENLDPFDAHDDAILNDALRSAGLFTLQKDMEDGQITLDSQISSAGSNLSVGQRQIIALARAIVRGSKLLILDEATSAIDFATDSIIQESLRTELSTDVTLITIAHRLQTVFDFDKIMVLDAGNLVEFDSPLSLLHQKESFLRKLVDESPDKDILWEMAEGKKR
ncbi:hypothetical protein DL96DRAFT_1730898 [Flagelloscypha sp. PMI_526]|nr:hypothetical protein DL96DRAFT_1730898 [Flagelloscypha sp. PMI_526]